jgi:hypothetical protein
LFVKTIDLTTAVADAVRVVNDHRGETCVRLLFAGDPEGIDFIANAGRFQDGRFEFHAGFETLSGSVEELADIRAEIIKH